VPRGTDDGLWRAGSTATPIRMASATSYPNDLPLVVRSAIARRKSGDIGALASAIRLPRWPRWQRQVNLVARGALELRREFRHTLVKAVVLST